MLPKRLLLPLVLPLLAAVVARPSLARACAHATFDAQSVHTNREDALIVWDEAHHLEHFVRNAVFETTAKSFAFLVPTPTRPTLAEANDTVAATLATITAPAITQETHYGVAPIGCTMLPFAFFLRSASKMEAATSGASAVNVLEQTRVAGLDAVVLEADDANALADWLRAHDYAFRDALKSWVAPYLARKWKITAFRYVRPDTASNAGMTAPTIASRAVRMTFSTDVPVYPYREPDDVPVVPDRELRLFVVGTTRVDGVLDGAPAGGGGIPWPASQTFSARTGTVPGLASALPGVELPPTLWINEFSDLATKRVASDLVFRPAASQAEVRRPPRIVVQESSIPLPYEIPLVGLWLWRRQVRRRRARHLGAVS